MSTASLLSDRAILRYMDEGKIVVDPFVRSNLGTTSMDVTLGPYYYRETEPEPGVGTGLSATQPRLGRKNASIVSCSTIHSEWIIRGIERLLSSP